MGMKSMQQSEMVRQAMRRWASGVAVVTSRAEDIIHGMTVNSFTSVSLDPPIISLSLAHATRTIALVRETGILAITFLSENQQELSDIFAGRIPEDADRFSGLETFTMLSGAPLLAGGLACLDCRVVFCYPMATSTLFLAEVLAVSHVQEGRPLLYFNRGYARMA